MTDLEKDKALPQKLQLYKEDAGLRFAEAVRAEFSRRKGGLTPKFVAPPTPVRNPLDHVFASAEDLKAPWKAKSIFHSVVEERAKQMFDNIELDNLVSDTGRPVRKIQRRR